MTDMYKSTLKVTIQNIKEIKANKIKTANQTNKISK